MIDELDLVVLKRDLPTERLAVGDVEGGADHGQRSAQLVGGVGDEPALRGERSVQAPERGSNSSTVTMSYLGRSRPPIT